MFLEMKKSNAIYVLIAFHITLKDCIKMSDINKKYIRFLAPKPLFSKFQKDQKT